MGDKRSVGYLTKQELMQHFIHLCEWMGSSARFCPNCYAPLEEVNDGVYKWMHCPNGMCLNDVEYTTE